MVEAEAVTLTSMEVAVAATEISAADVVAADASVVVAVDSEDHVPCTKPCVLTAERSAMYLLSLRKVVRYTAVTASRSTKSFKSTLER